MNEDKSESPVVDAHVSPDIGYANGPHGKCVGTDVPLQRGSSDVFVSSVSKGAATTSSTEYSNLSDSSSAGMEERGTSTGKISPPLHQYHLERLSIFKGLSGQQLAPVKIERGTTPDRLAPVRSAHQTEIDQENHPPTKPSALHDLLQQFAITEKLRAEQENTAQRLEERIRSAEIAHGMQLKQLAALQRAIELRRNDIGADKKAYTETRLAQQQTSQTSEELRGTLGRITMELHAGVQGSSHLCRLDCSMLMRSGSSSTSST